MTATTEPAAPTDVRPSILQYDVFEKPTVRTIVALIGKSTGYQCLAYDFNLALPDPPHERALSASGVQYDAAHAAYKRIVTNLIDFGYTQDTTAPSPGKFPPPEVGALSNGYHLLSADDAAAFIQKNGPRRVVDPTRDARVTAKQREIANKVAVYLTHPKCSIVDPGAVDAAPITITKNGGVITITPQTDPNVVELARRVALELGGTFTLAGAIVDGVFCVSQVPPDISRAFERARPTIVRRAAPVPAREKADLLAQLLRANEPIVFVDGDGVHHAFKPEQLLAAREHMPPHAQALIPTDIPPIPFPIIDLDTDVPGATPASSSAPAAAHADDDDLFPF